MLKKTLFLLLILFALSLNCISQDKKEHLSICFVGDVLLDRGVRLQIEKKGITHLFEDVSPLFHRSDAVIINLECPITKIKAPINKKYIFRAEPEWTKAIKKSGVTHAAMANNHTMDQGRRGLEDTHKHLTETNIKTIGYGRTQKEACSPVIISKNKIEVAIFNTVDIPIENWVYLENKSGICQESIPNICNSIKALKKKKTNVQIIVLLHWGIEFQKKASPDQRKKAHQLIDSGADIVIGHHPHVLQNNEIYKEKNIIYSLGNFIFDQRQPDSNKSKILEILFEEKKVKIIEHPVSIQNCKPKLVKE